MSRRRSQIAKYLPRDLADDKYQSACDEPLLWMMKAAELRQGADAVWALAEKQAKTSLLRRTMFEAPHCASVGYMLYAFVLENLLKASLVYQGKGRRAKDEAFALDSHRLENFADDLALPLALEERELLERMEAHLEWAGRYPIPLRVDDLRPRVFTIGHGSIESLVFHSDRIRIDSLIDRVAATLPTKDEAVQRYLTHIVNRRAEST